MALVVRRRMSSPLRLGMTWEETWRGEDRGLIKCWENGRTLVGTHPELAKAASSGELPCLDWKGGISGNPKMKKKFGSLQYLATWQGLRQQDLCIKVEEETTLTCTRSLIVVTFTPDLRKLDLESTNREEAPSEDT